MQKTIRTMPTHKHVALVAHDNCKPELLRWVKENKEKLQMAIDGEKSSKKELWEIMVP